MGTTIACRLCLTDKWSTDFCDGICRHQPYRQQRSELECQIVFLSGDRLMEAPPKGLEGAVAGEPYQLFADFSLNVLNVIE